MVGLGKTVQLAMAAKLIALYDEKPILIIVPKTLLYQWQDELMTLLNLPSAVWTGRYWVDENGYEYPADSTRAILKCPRKVGIISQGLITRKSESAGHLLNLRYACVILDEAHRARRKPGKDPDQYKAQRNNLLEFMNEISPITKSLLLATATPVQIDPIEAFDLLEALSNHQEAEKILGDKHSVWRRSPMQCLKYIQAQTCHTINLSIKYIFHKTINDATKKYYQRIHNTGNYNVKPTQHQWYHKSNLGNLH